MVKITTRLLLVFSSTGLMMLAACSSGEAGVATEQDHVCSSRCESFGGGVADP